MPNFVPRSMVDEAEGEPTRDLGMRLEKYHEEISLTSLNEAMQVKRANRQVLRYILV